MVITVSLAAAAVPAATGAATATATGSGSQALALGSVADSIAAPREKNQPIHLLPVCSAGLPGTDWAAA